MIDINLLPQKNLLSVNENKFKNLSVKVVIVISLALTVVSGIIFGFKIFTDNQLSSQVNKRDLLFSQFQSQSETAKQFRTLKNKVAGIKIIQDSRTNFAAITKKIRDTSSGTNLRSFEIDSDGKISLSAEVNSITDLDNFINRISLEKDNTFDKSILSGLTRKPNGGFTYSVTAQYLFFAK